jgi:diacylglycerol kinase (ATP)
MKAAFIINPVAGAGGNKPLQQLELLAKANGMQPAMLLTAYAGHGKALAAESVANGYEAVVAVGGDGTVNEVASSLRHSSSVLGIIPAGSGNGLARHFGIPSNMAAAIKIIGRKKTSTIDTMEINGRFSVNISGVGFDAHVAGLFASHGKRGFITYSKLSLREFIAYKPLPYTLELPDRKIETQAFIIVFANTTQWGNNAKIAPCADACDGLITVGILENLPAAGIPEFVTRLFSGRLTTFKNMKYIHAASVTVHTPIAVPLHIDGEPAGMAKEIKATSIPSSLKIIIP